MLDTLDDNLKDMQPYSSDSSAEEFDGEMVRELKKLRTKDYDESSASSSDDEKRSKKRKKKSPTEYVE